MTSRQLNIRLELGDSDRLNALAYLSRQQPSVLARTIVLEYLQRHRNDPGLEEALQGLQAKDAAEGVDAVVRNLHSR